MNENMTAKKEFKVGGFQSHFTLLVCSLLFVMYFVDWYMIGIVLQPMKLELGINDAQAGAIQTVCMVSVALFSFPNSYVVDRWSRRKAIVAMALFWSIFMFMTGRGQNFWGVLIPRALMGIGIAGFSGAAAALVSAAYPKRLRGIVMGIFNASVPVGGAIGVMLGGYLAARYSWRTPFYVFAIPGVILAVLAFFIKDYKSIPECDESGRILGFINTASTLFRISSLKWLYIGYGLQNVMAFSFIVWGPSFLMRSQGLSAEKAGLIVGIIAIMAIIGAPLGGVVADLWQKKNKRGRMLAPAIFMPVAALLLALSVLFNLEGAGLIMGILFGIVSIMGVPALSAVTQDVVPPGLKAASWGMSIVGMYLFGGAFAPMLVGALSDALGGGAQGLKIAIMIGASGGILAGICYWLGAKAYPGDREKVKDTVLLAEERVNHLSL